MYEQLDPRLRGYVDDLLEHARTALWPERRAAIESLWRGMSQTSPDDQQAAVAALGLELDPEADPAELLFRLVLTAYLQQLEEPEITNPDQAVLFFLSLDEGHAQEAEQWFLDHPEHRPPQT